MTDSAEPGGTGSPIRGLTGSFAVVTESGPITSLFSPSSDMAQEKSSPGMVVARTASGGASVEGRLTSPVARVPEAAARCGGITVKGRNIRALAYTTDVAVIRNCNADAILAVYPFTGEPIITQALMSVAQQPLFVGVGGGTTTGPRVVELAMMAEMQGAAGVVLNSPASAETVQSTMSVIDIPVVATIVADDETVDEKILAGAAIINVAGGRRTAEVVAGIRARHPEMPIMASGGKTDESILATIAAGADAVTWTPPSAQELQWSMMARYREG